MKNNIFASLVLGGLFLLCGSTWLIANVAGWEINFAAFWPAFLLVPGLIVLSNYIVDRSDAGMLIGGIILILLSLTFFLNNFLSQATGSGLIWTITIFMYPGSVAVALWAAWLTKRQDFKLAVAAMVLSAVSLFLLCLFSFIVIVDRFFAATGVGRFVWPLALICVGFVNIFVTLALITFRRRTEKWRNKFEDFGRKLESFDQDPTTPVTPTASLPMAQEAEIVAEKKPEPENINNNY